MGTLHRLQRSCAGTDSYAYTIGVLLRHIQSRILQSFLRCRHCILGEKFHPLSRLEIHIVLSFKSLDFRRQFTLKVCGVKSRDLVKPNLSFFHAGPKFIHT